MSNSNNTGKPAGTRRPGRGWKILLGLVVVLVLLVAVAEFGLRAYAKNTVVDEIRSTSQESGAELPEDPSVSFGASPLLLGLVQGKIPSFEASIPSSLNVTYEDSDKSRPVVSGQPALTINARDMSTDTDNPTVSEIDVDTTLPPEFLLAEIQKSQAEGGTGTDGGDGDAGGLLEGLIEVTGVTMNTDNDTMDLEITGGLATLSMSPVVEDGALNFTVDNLRILGMDLPESMVASLTDSLQQTVNDVDGLQIQDARITGDGLSVTLHGTDVSLDQVSSSTSSFTEDRTTGDGSAA
ncbi:DUF2993 domain-containing protein [Corynebacterium sp. USCH3]|uniref:LmeA family phospholipid-binding protein n=1 Tax=Corynebacterium sp. USCH3 TaxID=3024840 RepID=UPI00309C9144